MRLLKGIKSFFIVSEPDLIKRISDEPLRDNVILYRSQVVSSLTAQRTCHIITNKRPVDKNTGFRQEECYK